MGGWVGTTGLYPLTCNTHLSHMDTELHNNIYKYDYSIHPCNTIIKFADDTALVGLITKDDDTAYRDDVIQLTERCDRNYLTLNTRKTKEVIIDFLRYKAEPPSLYKR